MAIKFGFFNSIDGDRKYSAADIGNYLMGIISSGVYADSSTSLQVLANDGMDVEVQPGRAMLHYHYMENDSPLVLTLAAGGTQDRVDAIVAQLDMNNRRCDIVIKKGTEAAKPTAPTMERTDTVKEYMLASVYVAKLSASITQSSITDTRANKSVCGWVTGIIDQVDTSTLFNQWKAAYDEAMAEMDAALAAQQQTFEAWYAALIQNYVDGSGLPIPGTGDAGKIPTVNDTGTGYVLGPQVGEIVKAARVVNLLDNSDFSNPVNRRGLDSYTSIGYTIDCWRTWSEGETVTVQSGYITKTGNLAQTVSGLDPNKVYTAAVCLNDGTIDVSSNVLSAGIGAWARLFYGQYSESTGLLTFRLTSNAVDVKWAALYEGKYTAETLPPYQPKGKKVEELNCGALSVPIIATLPASGWVDNSTYFSQTVAVESISSEIDYMVDTYMVGKTVTEKQLINEEWSKVYEALAADGSMTVRATDAPTVDIPVKVVNL